MAERKQVNKYYPPDWDPKKHGSVNAMQGSHPLRERAKKLHLGILVIRFEMPYNIWCEGCNNHIGTGVRYNAEKSKTGKYYSTPVYKFRMKCHLCDNYIEMQTDPQNLDYAILSGARRQERRWDPTDNEQVCPEDKDITKKLATDAMFRLEHGVEDKQKRDAVAPVIEKLEELQERWRDDYDCNRLLRQQFRVKRKEIQETTRKDKALLEKSSLKITLLPENEKDVKLASLIKLEPTESFDERRKALRGDILSQSIFDKDSPSTATLLPLPPLVTSPCSHLRKKAKAASLQKVQTLSKLSNIDLLGISVKPKSSVEQQSLERPVFDANVKERTCLVADYGESDSE